MSEMSYTGHEEEDDDGFEMAAVYDTSDKSKYLDSIGGVEDEAPRGKSTREALGEQNLQFVFGETLSIASVANNEPIKVPEGYNPFKHHNGSDTLAHKTKKRTMAEEILEEQAKRFQSKFSSQALDAN